VSGSQQASRAAAGAVHRKHNERCFSGDADSERRFARRAMGQLALEGATCSMNSSRRSLVDLPRMLSAEMTTTAPPKPSERIREHVNDDTADTYLSLVERRTIS
jgi:hypothetical protein